MKTKDLRSYCGFLGPVSCWKWGACVQRNITVDWMFQSRILMVFLMAVLWLCEALADKVGSTDFSIVCKAEFCSQVGSSLGGEGLLEGSLGVLGMGLVRASWFAVKRRSGRLPEFMKGIGGFGEFTWLFPQPSRRLCHPGTVLNCPGSFGLLHSCCTSHCSTQLCSPSTEVCADRLGSALERCVLPELIFTSMSLVI